MTDDILHDIQHAYDEITRATARARAECDALVARAIAEGRVKQGAVADHLGVKREAVRQMQLRARAAAEQPAA